MGAGKERPVTGLPEPAKKVLVLDDEPDARALIEIVLRPAGYDIRPAADGEEALRMLREEPVAVALVDLLMPGMSGVAFLREIESLPAENRPVVIVCSGRRQEEIESDVDGLIAFDILTKPFELHDLERRVERAWQEKIRLLRS